MFGLITLGLILVMIYGLVSQAVKGKVANSSAGKVPGKLSICMILKDQHNLTPLQLENNLKVFSQLPDAEFLLMVQGIEAEVYAYEELQKRYPVLKVFMVPNHPQVSSVSGWMMQELLKLAKGDYLLLLQPQLDVNLEMINSAMSECAHEEMAVYGLAQVKREFFLAESVFALNPQLIISSLKLPLKWKKNIKLSSLSDFTNYFLLLNRKQLTELGPLDLTQTGPVSSLVDSLMNLQQLKLMYGERHLSRRVPQHRSLILFEIRQFWSRLLNSREKTPLILFSIALFVWSFPWLFAATHLYWALVGFALMGIYRFFTKIVFQESWPNLVLHPLACIFWWYGLAQVIWAKRKS